MQMSEVKDYLNRARVLKRAIDTKQSQIEKLQSMAIRATGTYEAERISGTSSRSKLEDSVLDIIDLKDELGIKMSMFREAYREIMVVIEAVDNPTYRELLNLRYLCFMTWEQVAVKMNYSYVHVVHRLHPKALQAVAIIQKRKGFKI